MGYLKDKLEIDWASYPCMSDEFIDIHVSDSCGNTFVGVLRLSKEHSQKFPNQKVEKQ